jgi:hypothetical protein
MPETFPLHVRFRRDHQCELFFAIVLILTIPVAIGIWRAQEWARVMFGIIAAVMATLGVGVLALRVIHQAPIGETIWKLCLQVMWSFMAYHLLRPGSRESFAAARKSMARGRAVPG